jgi:hypothetical protein
MVGSVALTERERGEALGILLGALGRLGPGERGRLLGALYKALGGNPGNPGNPGPGGGEEEVWYGVNIADLTEVPGIEAVGWILLPPRERGYIVQRGPNVDDFYVFWRIPKARAQGIDFVLHRKLPRIRTEMLLRPPEPYRPRI